MRLAQRDVRFRRDSGKVLGLMLRTFEARTPGGLRAAFTAMTEWRADGLIELNDGMFYSERERVVALSQQSRLASMHPEIAFVEAGALASYGPSFPDLFRRAGNYAGKTLQGAKPTDLPVEQPTKGGISRMESEPSRLTHLTWINRRCPKGQYRRSTTDLPFPHVATANVPTIEGDHVHA
jgi:hypothetical protein